MKRLLIIVICLGLCLGGCAYSSANMMRAQGKDIMVFGAWGYVHCQDSAITMYRSTDTMSYIKGVKEYPKVPTRPNISEQGQVPITIGKAGKTTVVTPIPDNVNP